MKRRHFLSLISAAALAACEATTTATQPGLAADGKPLPRVYRIGAGNKAAVQFRLLDGVNALRKAAGAPALSMNSRLTAAAATHARDMAVQNRPWHFGSDGSSPVDRVQRAGYRGRLVGETISETYETEMDTLAAWMDQPETRRVILDKDARDLGFAWHQETGGKIWWCMVLGSTEMSQIPGGISTAS